MRKNTFTLKSNILYPKRNALAFIAPTAESNKWWEEEVPSMSRVKHASSALPSPGQYAVSSKPERSRARSEAAHRRELGRFRPVPHDKQGWTRPSQTSAQRFLANIPDSKRIHSPGIRSTDIYKPNEDESTNRIVNAVNEVDDSAHVPEESNSIRGTKKSKHDERPFTPSHPDKQKASSHVTTNDKQSHKTTKMYSHGKSSP